MKRPTKWSRRQCALCPFSKPTCMSLHLRNGRNTYIITKILTNELVAVQKTGFCIQKFAAHLTTKLLIANFLFNFESLVFDVWVKLRILRQLRKLRFLLIDFFIIFKERRELTV